MLKDPYAVLRALLRAEASRTTAGPESRPGPRPPAPATPREGQHPAARHDRG